MIKNILVYLDDILESNEKIALYIKDKNKVEFTDNTELQDAVIRRLSMIGEAIKSLPQDFHDQHPEIKATGMRDILVHNYDEVNMDQIWLTVTNVLPAFCEHIKKLLIEIEK